MIKKPYLKDMIKECDNILRDITLKKSSTMR